MIHLRAPSPDTRLNHDFGPCFCCCTPCISLRRYVPCQVYHPIIINNAIHFTKCHLLDAKVTYQDLSFYFVSNVLRTLLTGIHFPQNPIFRSRVLGNPTHTMTFPNDCRITSHHHQITVSIRHVWTHRAHSPLCLISNSPALFLGSPLYRLIPETIGGVFDNHQSLRYARTAMTHLISLGAFISRFRLYLPDRRLLKLLF